MDGIPDGFPYNGRLSREAFSAVSTRVPNVAPEGEPLPDPSSEETDTTVDKPLVRAPERRRTATFGPAVTNNPGMHEQTDATVPRLDPTAPLVARAAARGRSWTAVLPVLAIGALLGLVLVTAYASCR